MDSLLKNNTDLNIHLHYSNTTANQGQKQYQLVSSEKAQLRRWKKHSAELLKFEVDDLEVEPPDSNELLQSNKIRIRTESPTSSDQI